MCPSGWSLYDGSCYKLYTDAKTYYEAQQVCKQMDGDLAMAKTTPVNDLLARLLTSEGVNAALLGLHDLATEQAFYWVDGTALTAAGSTSH
ncbi:alpha-N-acetylgalactosamine-specific lectin-like [Strongylocentrotus purpuratus]|uniref:C-type lectin domain-containing protein n=1 Tax=Strongylocentrotus purpuratus TaxID=7668 RepID=A0A7M7PUU5_STRPU|nr:alpha-N-acetylgalactosamine-specific lectin-like [Strongylocentrotus purpuratus]